MTAPSERARQVAWKCLTLPAGEIAAHLDAFAAEAVRGLDNVLIIQTETIRQAQETIRRLEGEVARQTQFADQFRDLNVALEQRAEAAEGLLKTFLVSQPGHTCQGAPACPICRSPATGQGA